MTTSGTTVRVPVSAIVYGAGSPALAVDIAATANLYSSRTAMINIAGTVDGQGQAGIGVLSGSVSAGGYDYYGTRVSVAVAAGGVVTGSSGITVGASSGNAYGLAIVALANAGTIGSTSGIALSSSTPATAGFVAITNLAGGTIGAIAGPVGILNNAGTIDGGANSAVDIGTTYNFNITPGAWANSGTITSAATGATLRNLSSNTPLTNTGTIADTGSGSAIQGGGLSITNGASGIIQANGGAAITATQLALLNAGTITGNVTVVSSTGFGGGSTIDSSAGTINGNVTLGTPSDIVVARYVGTPNLATGITGTLDGGGGINAIQLMPTQNLTIATAVTLPSTFQRLRLTPAAGTTITLANGFVTPGTIELTGNGSVTNNAAIVTSGQVFVSPAVATSYLANLTNTGAIATTVNSGVAGLDLYGIGTFNNSGTIAIAGGNGVSQSSVGSFVNSGSITAAGTAVTLSGGQFTNQGSIQSTGGIGVALSGNVGTPAYNGGSIQGATVGAQTSITLTNAGTIVATQASGVAVALDAYGVLINAAGGVVGNGNSAVTASVFNSAVVNAGTINGSVALANVYSGAGQRYIALTGGILNGNLSLTAGDLFVTDLAGTTGNSFAGVNGTVSAASGALLRLRVSGNASNVVGPFGPFAVAGFELANGATLTLAGRGERMSENVR